MAGSAGREPAARTIGGKPLTQKEEEAYRRFERDLEALVIKERQLLKIADQYMSGRKQER